jgi:DNA (cytosine-5)-methyltransferase 1
MDNKIVSLFSGCGGLDLGFQKAGFQVIWANEYDKEIWETYEKNSPETFLDRRDIRTISSSEIPDCVGIIGGPPCQSWSEGGTQRGIHDDRGQLFLEYIRILRDKQPQFFLAENVSGLLHQKHKTALRSIIAKFEEAGYVVSIELLNAGNYNVPQDRKRVIFIGYHVDLNRQFHFELLQKETRVQTLRDAIWNLRDSALPAIDKNKTNGDRCRVDNHEYMTGGFSSIYMSRNRVRAWNEPSFTIQAGGRHAPIHPQANKMIHVGKDKFIFDPSSSQEYRRLSIRECARIQTFSDEFVFYYRYLSAAYKMIGNAVPVELGYALAHSIYQDLLDLNNNSLRLRLPNNLDNWMALQLNFAI